MKPIVEISGLVKTFGAFTAMKSHVGHLPDDPASYDVMRGREIFRFAGEIGR
jgi:ABC-type multidrug transport system ATPase subunit